MCENKTVDYKALFERLETTLDEVADMILLTRSDCELILETAGERPTSLSPEAEKRLEALIGALRLEAGLKDDAVYKKMYLTLFNKITHAISQIERMNFGRAKDILIEAQKETEEMYISFDE